MKAKLLTSLFLLLSFSPIALAEAPAGYYNSLNGKKEGELKTAVYTLVHNFTKISSYSDLPKYFQHTDVYPESKRWWDMYSDIPLYAPSFSGLNREHSFPKSWWGGSTTIPAYTDLNHLYPSEAKANQAKSNWPLGTVNTMSELKFDNGLTKVGYPVNGQGGNAQFVFEPADEYKGDFARTYFYMATCYQDLTWKYTWMVQDNVYPTLSTWAVKLLLEWHRMDPVSQKERDRNDVVYSYQNNRNPFIDLPELAEYIWGEKKGESFTPGDVNVPVGDPQLLAPSLDMTLDFGEVAIGDKIESQLFVHSNNLSRDVEIFVIGANRSLFKLSTNRIPFKNSNSSDGYWVTVTYTPNAVGSHTAQLSVAGEFGSRNVDVLGECFPVPVLSACTATAPTDIESDRYVANWEAPSGEVIDYYMVTRTVYTGAEVYTEELPAEETSLEILGFDQSDRESYSVQSVRLGKRSPMSNVVFVDHSGITGVETEEPLIIQSFAGFVRFICSKPQHNCRIYDAAGNLVRMIDEVAQDTDIELPVGIYLIVTDEHPAPVKAVSRP